MFLWLWTILLFVIGNVYGAFDPCLNGNFKFLNTPGLRGGKCKLQRNKIICDRYIDDGWYKVLHEDDLEPRKMLEGIVNFDYCGTSSPIWLNGTHPSITDGIVNRTACVTGMTGYCNYEYPIQIKACAVNDFVYFLKKTVSCYEGYCFGVNMPCAKPNPCEPGNSKILHAGGDRSTSCQDLMTLCDDSMSNVWYRVQRDGIDLKMPNTCIAQNSCGTVSPVWLQGSEPSIPDKVVSRKACVSDGNRCACSKFYNIQIRNCSSFLVYNLTSTDSCPERYCFGTDGECRNGNDEHTGKSNSLDIIIGVIASILILVMSIGVGYALWKHYFSLVCLGNMLRSPKVGKEDPKVSQTDNLKSKTNQNTKC